MHRIRLTAFLIVSLLTLISAGQTPPDPKAEQQQQLLALVKEVQAQQAQIVANQAAIDTKLAALAETMRVARIFSSRSH
jgi:hypothetical protein